MESVASKQIIIEFNGLPGSGKTTTSRLLQQKLNGLDQKTAFSYYRKSINRNVFSILFAFKFRKLVWAIKQYSKTFPSKRSLSLCLSYVSFIRMYQDFCLDNKNELLLVDQGLVQSLISLAHKDPLPQNNYLNQVLQLSKLDCFPLIIVNCNINKDLSMGRIEQRQQKKGRLDSMDVEERIHALSIQNDNFNSIRKELRNMYSHLHMIDIDMTRHPEENANELVYYLQSLGIIKN